ERVDHHLAVDRPGDLAAAVPQVARGRGDAPLALAHGARLVEEVRPLAGVERRLALAPSCEQLEPARVQLAMEQRDEVERFGREYGFVGGRGDRDLAGDQVFAGSNCASSVEPRSAS